MMNTNRAKGTCLCGSVKVSVELDKDTFDACHCQMCRKWGGGPALTVDGGKNISFSGEAFIATYSSSAWAERGFCKNCGTHLFYRLKNSDYCNFPLGLLDGTDHLKFHTQIFIDLKPKCYEFANQTENLTETEVLAKFGQPPTLASE
jgi:hypothetical protein